MWLRCAMTWLIFTCLLECSVGKNDGDSLSHGSENETDSDIGKVFRKRRNLVYNGDDSVFLMTAGLGLPVQQNKEVVIIGPYVKALYYLPYNVTYYNMEPDARTSRDTKSRWSFYKVLEAVAEILGFGGKECMLRAICEVANVPFDDSHGLLAELLHVFLTPSTTNEAFDEYQDRQYCSAERMGMNVDENCQDLYPECQRSILDVFSAIDF